MAKLGMKALWAFCTIQLYSIRYTSARVCDFGAPIKPLNRYALVGCDIDMDDSKNATVICPRQVNDTEYVWHPQPNLDDHAAINTYVSENGMFRSVALSDVVLSESGVKLFGMDSPRSHTTLSIDLPTNKLFAITENRLIFICGPRSLVLSDALQRHLHRLGGFREKQSFPWMPPTPLAEEITKIGNGLGVVFVNRGRDNIPLQGCGSRPSALFAPDNVVAVDPVTGVRSCVVDPMSDTPIGFLCEGRIEPADCMRSLLDENGEVVKPPRPHSYRKFDNVPPWRVARYFNDLAFPMFTGECRCIGSDTGELMAKIEIRSKTDYVCDISSMIVRNRSQPIRGPWCSVVLHPGSTLTIRFPTVDADSATNDDATQLLPTGEFEAEFLPKDLTTLRQLKTTYDIDLYEEILYNKALAEDALELDVSKMDQGEVKFKYHENKLLALKRRRNSFLYHWRLKSTNEDFPDKVRAIVKVSLALTHHYRAIACDRGTPAVFDPQRSKQYCSLKSMANGLGDVYECNAYINDGFKQVGIYCRADEFLLPRNCESMGYDLHSHRIRRFYASVQRGAVNAIPGFQVFDIGTQNPPISYACMCVDQDGYEKSKLILEYSREVYRSYTVRLEDASRTLLPHILLPWGEIGLSSQDLTSSMPLILSNVSIKSVKLHVGTKLTMPCAFDFSIEKVAGSRVLRTTWLPKQPDEFHYTISNTSYGRELIRRSHKDVIVGTPRGLNFVFIKREMSYGYQFLIIESRRGSIVISKNMTNTKYVPMTFLCTKTPVPSDFTLVTGDGSTPDVSAPFIPNSIASSTRYTWNVVEVDVETTDPYMQGCGVTYSSDELFRPETPQLYDSDGKPQFGCKIDLQDEEEAAFYCPPPYFLDPPNCFSRVFVDGIVKNTVDLSESLVASRSNHFVILKFDESLVGPGETLHQTPPLQCRCITVNGTVLSTIQIENYYSKL
ncbi:hypothetical protein, conserved [Babesia ovata]|uniref:6-Cys domain-containing protein n=1 Tax=Babesia ovata TaxID=189622 RepID=A0A2H6K6M1_9APIC|nr:uncharacterized protein BOVATA_001290 [Babesia ovata]GBE58636.1 hypothetical protein, conserved [Babesia ovata]